MSESLRAHFLIAVKGLRDPNFFKTVVLMVEDGDSGSMGLVVNRPSDLTVRRVLQAHFDLPDVEDLVYTGGPVEPTALFIVHNSVDADPNEQPLVPGLFVGSTEEAFQDVVRQIGEGDANIKFRIFRGCAGWAPDQLENELNRGDWLAIPATAEQILSHDPYVLWEELAIQAAKDLGIAPRGGDVNPEWN